jgi:hypothetical protein
VLGTPDASARGSDVEPLCVELPQNAGGRPASFARSRQTDDVESRAIVGALMMIDAQLGLLEGSTAVPGASTLVPRLLHLLEMARAAEYPSSTCRTMDRPAPSTNRAQLAGLFILSSRRSTTRPDPEEARRRVRGH